MHSHMKEEKMKNWGIICIALLLIAGPLSVEGWARPETVGDELNVMDILIARPIGIIAGITGTAVFVVTLPFTIPTKSTNKAAKMLITDPFRFSFSREFPDRSLEFD